MNWIKTKATKQKNWAEIQMMWMMTIAKNCVFNEWMNEWTNAGMNECMTEYIKMIIKLMTTTITFDIKMLKGNA